MSAASSLAAGGSGWISTDGVDWPHRERSGTDRRRLRPASQHRTRREELEVLIRE
jgi:hypothetical protein